MFQQKTGRFLAGFLISAGFLFPLRANAQWAQITVFVDEGRHDFNGHVFISLTDGTRPPLYYGFYSKNKALAPAALGEGEVRDDSGAGWDVKRVYNSL
jgi:hypothetical protein